MWDAGASTVPGEEHKGSSNPRVVAVMVGGKERPFKEAAEPDGYPLTVSGGFEWGYGGSGPINLAAAILNDALGFLPAASMVLDFCESVVAELPRLEFELSPDVLQAWLDARLASGAEAARSGRPPAPLDRLRLLYRAPRRPYTVAICGPPWRDSQIGMLWHRNPPARAVRATPAQPD